jgi:UDP-2,3-diacylglucosamine pyrophosphatase LpxH
MDFNEISHNKDEVNFVIKGDIHTFNWNSGKFFEYINCPSVMGATGWIMENFGNSKAGIFYLVVDKNKIDYTSGTIRF